MGRLLQPDERPRKGRVIVMSAELVEKAIALAQGGKHQEAGELLVQVITADVHNETAWLWYAFTLQASRDRIKALEECLHHNPDCQEAEKRLATLRARRIPITTAKQKPASSTSRWRGPLVLAGGLLGMLVSCVVLVFLALSRRSGTSSPRILTDASAVISEGNAASVVRLGQIETPGTGQIVWSSDGKILAAADFGGIHLYDAASLTEIRSLSSKDFETVAFSPDGQMIASDWEGNAVRLWRSSDGYPLITLNDPRGKSGDPVMGQVVRVGFAPDGSVVASAKLDDGVQLWQTDGRLLYSLRHADFVAEIAFSPDGKKLASGGADAIVRLWQLKTGELLAELRGHEDHVYALAFSPDGQILASGSDDRTIRLWKAEDGALLQTLGGDVGPVTSLSFTPDGQVLASGGFTGARLWRVSDGMLLKTLRGDDHGFVMSVAFSPDGRILASDSGPDSKVSVSGFIRLWGVP